MMLATCPAGPFKEASRMNWGIWVVLPHLEQNKQSLHYDVNVSKCPPHTGEDVTHPVIPVTTRTWLCSSTRRMFSLSCHAGSFLLCSNMDVNRLDDWTRGGGRAQTLNHTHTLTTCLSPRTLIHQFPLELSAQLAVLLQMVVQLQCVLVGRLLPQVDVALVLHGDGLVFIFLLPLIQLLCLCCLCRVEARFTVAAQLYFLPFFGFIG